jgi:hypothetical protein
VRTEITQSRIEHLTHNSAGDRIQRFMGRDTDVHGIAVRVVELTGRAGDAVLPPLAAGRFREPPEGHVALPPTVILLAMARPSRNLSDTAERV